VLEPTPPSPSHLQEEACTFDLLVYTDTETAVPVTWEESDPRYIAQSAEVKLRSFTTSIHKVAPTVSYKAPSAT
jgi:mitotic spindle assembly checkpoint protein MAD2